MQGGSILQAPCKNIKRQYNLHCLDENDKTARTTRPVSRFYTRVFCDLFRWPQLYLAATSNGSSISSRFGAF